MISRIALLATLLLATHVGALGTQTDGPAAETPRGPCVAERGGTTHNPAAPWWDTLSVSYTSLAPAAAKRIDTSAPPRLHSPLSSPDGAARTHHSALRAASIEDTNTATTKNIDDAFPERSGSVVRLPQTKTTDDAACLPTCSTGMYVPMPTRETQRDAETKTERQRQRYGG